MTERVPLVTMDRDGLWVRLTKLLDRVSAEQIIEAAAGRTPAMLSDDGLRMLIARLERSLQPAPDNPRDAP